MERHVFSQELLLFFDRFAGPSLIRIFFRVLSMSSSCTSRASVSTACRLRQVEIRLNDAFAFNVGESGMFDPQMFDTFNLVSTGLGEGAAAELRAAKAKAGRDVRLRLGDGEDSDDDY